MNKLYNTQKEITTNLRNFLKESSSLYKPQLNFIPELIFGMISSESVVSSDIARTLKEEFSLIQHNSITKKIRRLFNNKRFDGIKFYNEIISYIIDNYKIKHKNNKIHLIIDHMYCKENYTVLMVSMRVGTQGIPICFKCFEGIRDPEAFYDYTIIKIVDEAYSLFKNKNFDIVFLADRWFNSKALLKHIDMLGCKYAIRLKSNLKISVFDKKENHRIHKYSGDLISWKHKSLYYEDVLIYEDLTYKTNIAVSRKCANNDEAWIITTNKNPKEAIRDYTHRFGGIECLFKNQKSNGFYLEKICTASLNSFNNLYSLLCFSITFLVIIGSDYCKNTRSYKKTKITTHKNINGKKVRVKSLFNTGLTLFKLAFNSLKYVRISYKFILYDI